MKLKYFGLVCVALLVIATSVLAGGGGKKGKWSKGKNMTCKGQPIKMEEMWKGTKECWQEMKPTGAPETAPETAPQGDEVAAEGGNEGGSKKKGKKWGKGKMGKMMCMKVCQMKKQGLLNAAGEYDSAGADTYIKSCFPTDVQAEMLKKFDECQNKIGTPEERTEEKKCGGYREFKKCTRTAFMDVCDIKSQWGKKDGGGGGEEGGADAGVDEPIEQEAS